MFQEMITRRMHFTINPQVLNGMNPLKAIEGERISVIKMQIYYKHIVCFIALNKIICKHKEPKLLVNKSKNLF